MEAMSIALSEVAHDPTGFIVVFGIICVVGIVFLIVDAVRSSRRRARERAKVYERPRIALPPLPPQSTLYKSVNRSLSVTKNGKTRKWSSSGDGPGSSFMDGIASIFSDGGKVTDTPFEGGGGQSGGAGASGSWVDGGCVSGTPTSSCDGPTGSSND
jgi:uncharacterized membrane protein YgcG